VFGHRQAIDDGPIYPKGRPQENKNKSSTQTPQLRGAYKIRRGEEHLKEIFNLEKTSHKVIECLEIEVACAQHILLIK
jgi:hypothetical protein